MGLLFKVYSFFCSVKLAVFVLTVLIVLSTAGTIYESYYGNQGAKEIIYHSLWMHGALFLLAINIMAVMIDRWPWKKKHIPFLLAHIGILLVLSGSALTRLYGVDGSLVLKIGEKNNFIQTTQPRIVVYSSFDGKSFTQFYNQRVLFFKNPPVERRPYKIPLGKKTLKISQFLPAALFRPHYELSDSHQPGGSAVRFQITGTRANISDWLFKPSWSKRAGRVLGPAQIYLVDSFEEVKQIKLPTLLLKPHHDQLKYELRKPQAGRKKGILKAGSTLQTGWMDFQFQLVSFLPHANSKHVWTPQERVSKDTIPAIKVTYGDQTRWMGLNSQLRFFDQDKVFVVAFVNERVLLDFDLQLEDFSIQYYPFSQKASNYNSTVFINGETKHISMNEPAQAQGYTIYQSGFEKDDMEVPVASAFSINKDPGREVKYLGSFLVVLGSFLLFYRKNKKTSIKSRKRDVQALTT